MADEADDVLELDQVALEGDEPEDKQTDGDIEGDEDGEETIPTFADEEGAAPAPEETSVIRELRQRNRELTQRLKAADQAQAPKQIEVGPKPSLESCEYDEDRFETELDAWKARKSDADTQANEAAERQQAQKAEWEGRVEAYKASKTSLRVPDFEAAEEEVFAALPEQTQALLMLSENPASLVYALSKSPTKLKELSELNLAMAAMMIGKLGATMTTTKRALPSPDRPLRGSAPLGGTADKQLERLEKEADRTGDRTKLIAYRRKLSTRA